ncbi:MAG: hypothetical protein AAFS08_00845 [Pseudomonadota bacterium]
MGKKNSGNPQKTKDPKREDRLKAALKANIKRRKAQEKAKATGQNDENNNT